MCNMYGSNYLQLPELQSNIPDDLLRAVSMVSIEVHDGDAPDA